MDLNVEGILKLNDLSDVNIILGKNGAGKSTLLKKIADNINDGSEINYVTPERGGTLAYNSSVEQNLNNDPLWSKSVKKVNQWNQFKHYSISQYRKLELLSLREIETIATFREDLTYTFQTVIDNINKLLTNIKLVRSTKGDIDIEHIISGEKLKPEQISSGESELISLAIECLTFEKTCQEGKYNLLLLDEPDVHLHPDLQAKFILFLLELIKKNKFKIIIATHSTAILGALLEFENSRFGILENGKTEINFKPINELYKNILPIFGAHPLSNLFNENPIMLVEGEDDVRVWQQAIRTSNGRIKIYPCSVDSITYMNDYENAVIEIINGVYDEAEAYSLRDRDDSIEAIDDRPPLIRMRLSCRNAENLIVADEVLESLGSDWEKIKQEIEKWLLSHAGHSKFSEMDKFKKSGYDRKNFDLKEVRNILIMLTGTSKSWEIAVGQVIGKISKGECAKDLNEGKICNFLGEKLSNLIKP